MHTTYFRRMEKRALILLSHLYRHFNSLRPHLLPHPPTLPSIPFGRPGAKWTRRNHPRQSPFPSLLPRHDAVEEDLSKTESAVFMNELECCPLPLLTKVRSDTNTVLDNAHPLEVLSRHWVRITFVLFQLALPRVTARTRAMMLVIVVFEWAVVIWAMPRRALRATHRRSGRLLLHMRESIWILWRCSHVNEACGLINENGPTCHSF